MSRAAGWAKWFRAPLHSPAVLMFDFDCECDSKFGRHCDVCGKCVTCCECGAVERGEK